MDVFNAVVQTLDSTIRLSVPLLLACLAGLYSERAGIFDIGLEGKMLSAAFASAAVAALTGSAWAGLGAAIVVSTLMALLHGFTCITHRGDQVVSGVAINIVASGLTVVLGNACYQRGGETPQLDASERFMPIALPGGAQIANIPVVGPIYGNILSGHSLLT
jgi:simple sugar transport system permease protein